MKILAFDIGGTAIKYSICEDDKLLNVNEIPTNAMADEYFKQRHLF